MTEPNLTVELARFGRRASFDVFTDQVIDTVKRSILDTFACLMAGVASDEWPYLERGLRLSTEGDAAVLGTRLRADRYISALANGTSAHMDSFDDYVVRAGGHAGVSVVPAAIAAAPPETSGKSFLAAVAVGYEVMTMLGDRLAKPAFERGHHATGTHGAVAAAAAAARVADLPPDQFAHALGMGVSQAAGLRVQFGSMAKPFQAGHAAMAGSLAAGLAGAGFTPASDPLGGVMGLIASIAGESERATLVGRLVESASRQPGEFLTESPPTTKLHASCGSTHSAVDCAIELREKLDGQALSDVERIDISLPTKALRSLVHHRPETGLEAKYSVEFAVASGLTFGDAGRGRFVDSLVADPQLRALTEVGFLHDDPDFQVIRETDKFGGALPARVIVALPGRVIQAEVIHPVGSAQRPLAWGQLVQKFRENADPVIGEAKSLAAVAAIERLEELSDISDELVRYLIPVEPIPESPRV